MKLLTREELGIYYKEGAYKIIECIDCFKGEFK